MQRACPLAALACTTGYESDLYIAQKPHNALCVLWGFYDI